MNVDKNTPLIDKLAVIIHRCSGGSQVKDSLPQQRKAAKAFIEKYRIRVEKEVEAPAVSASIGKHKKLIYGLRDEKARGELKFEIMIFADWSRFTRTGLRDGHRILSDLEDEGIMVVTVKDGLLTGKDGQNRTEQSLRDSEAYAEAAAYNMSRGMQDAIENGEVPHTALAPYGTDRCYINEAGTPEFILRDAGPERKVMLDPVTREFIKELKHTPEEPAVKKQSSQRIVLVKGPPEEVKIVNQIFARRYIDGWGVYRICRELNEQKVPGPKCGMWHQTTIENIFRNSTYFGTGLANQTEGGVYVKRSRNAPIELHERRTPGKRKDGKGNRERIPTIRRPPEDYIPVEYPALSDFLDPKVREIARTAQEHNRHQQKQSKRKVSFVQGSYPLSGVLRTKQFDMPMMGTPSTSQSGVSYRYYFVRQAQNSPGVDGRLQTRIPAVSVEEKVRAAIMESLSDDVAISRSVREYIDKQIELASKKDDVVPALLSEKGKLEHEYRTIHEVYGKRGRELMQARCHELERLLDDVEARIKSATSDVPFRACDADAIIKSVKVQCKDAISLLSQNSAAEAKRVIQTFVSRATLDMETKEVDIEIALPTWALHPKIQTVSDVRTPTSNNAISGNRTHMISIAKYACRHEKSGYKGFSLCLNCTRLKTAA